MQRIGAHAARVFKTLAGQDREEPVGSFVYALYAFFFIVAMMLAIVWITGTPLECAVRATC